MTHKGVHMRGKQPEKQSENGNYWIFHPVGTPSGPYQSQAYANSIARPGDVVRPGFNDMTSPEEKEALKTQTKQLLERSGII